MGGIYRSGPGQSGTLMVALFYTFSSLECSMSLTGWERDGTPTTRKKHKMGPNIRIRLLTFNPNIIIMCKKNISCE